jgi:rod shape-determining protein MreC
VHDKQVRRRRAVLALLVVASLILLTAYFGESPNSPLHSVQRGIVEVLSPVQEGASKVLSPVRDIAGWFSDTLNAKSENAKLKNEVQTLTAELDHAQYAEYQIGQLRALVHLDQNNGIDSYSPLTATVIEHDPTLWFQTIEVDEGSDDGVHEYDPVIGGQNGNGGLVGVVTTVGPNYSIVTLLTDDKFAVSALVEDGAGDTGILQPAIGSPNQLVLGALDAHANIQQGDQVVTSGYQQPGDPSIQSYAPADIPIGEVSNADTQSTLANSQEVDVTPVVDLQHLSVVQILTKPQATNERASLP